MTTTTTKMMKIPQLCLQMVLAAAQGQHLLAEKTEEGVAGVAVMVVFVFQARTRVQLATALLLLLLYLVSSVTVKEEEEEAVLVEVDDKTETCRR